MPAEAVARARALIGCRFRLHGRSAVEGLDCIGVVALAYGFDAVPTGYALRTADVARIADGLAAAGFRAIERLVPGAVISLAAGPAQLHLGIWTGDAMVHADAALRRVVETPGVPRWPVLGIWER